MDKHLIQVPTPASTVKPLPKDANPVFNGSAPTTEVNRVEYSSSGTVRVIEVPSQAQNQGFTWNKAFDEIRAGIWAVGLTAAFLWVATSSLRNKVGEGLSAYFKKQVEILDNVKTSTSNNSVILTAMENRGKQYADAVETIKYNTNESLRLLRQMNPDDEPTELPHRRHTD